MAKLTRSMRRRLLTSGVLALATTVLLSAAHSQGFLAKRQDRSSDLPFRARPAQKARATVIVGIDEQSYRALLPEHGAYASCQAASDARTSPPLMSGTMRNSSADTLSRSTM